MPEPPYVVDRNGVMSPGTTVDPREWQIDLAPRELTYIYVNFQVALLLDDVHVSIGGPFSVKRGRDTYWLDPEDRAGLGPVLAIYPATLAASTVEPAARFGSRSTAAAASMCRPATRTSLGRSAVLAARWSSAHRACRQRCWSGPDNPVVAACVRPRPGGEGRSAAGRRCGDGAMQRCSDAECRGDRCAADRARCCTRSGRHRRRTHAG